MSTAEEGLMALLEAMLTLAAREARRPKPPPVKPGGYPEEHFIDLTEEEKDEFSCNICYQVLKETMQCVNNHKFCHSCLLVWSTTGQYANRIRCPVCRTHGYYFRNNEVDERIGAKKVKCLLDSCSWSGLLKYLSSHRHTTYGDTGGSATEDTENAVAMPRLAQASPRVPQSNRSRFVGTGLTTLGATDSPSVASTSGANHLGSQSVSRASPSSLSSTSQETIIELPRRATTNNSTSSRPPLRRVPGLRTSNNNRITFSHTNPNADTNNNVEDDSSNVSVRSSVASTAANSTASLVAGGHTPRPPSAPRTSANTVNARRLPRIINPPPLRPQGRRYQPPEALSLNVNSTGSPSLNLNVNSTGSPSLNPGGRSRPAENLGEIRDRLQESRNRLDNLMTSFSGELDRSRQEMAEFQQERERHRREQLEEVRELGQRLGQVASELRRLLEQRRHISSFSDDDDDDDE